jgi:hypothetical protein
VAVDGAKEQAQVNTPIDARFGIKAQRGAKVYRGFSRMQTIRRRDLPGSGHTAFSRVLRAYFRGPK